MLNKTTLQGCLVRDPETRTTPSGVSVTSFTVAWSEKYKETETKCFLSCTAWRGTGEFVAKYFAKGQEIIVEGSLSTRSYDDKDGNKRTVTELTVDKAHFCGAKRDAEGAGTNASTGTYAPTENNFEPLPDDDGQLPF